MAEHSGLCVWGAWALCYAHGAYFISSIDVLTLRALPIALPASSPSLFLLRIITLIDELTLRALPIAFPASSPSLLS